MWALVRQEFRPVRVRLRVLQALERVPVAWRQQERPERARARPQGLEEEA